MATWMLRSWQQFEQWAGAQIAFARGNARLLHARASCLRRALVQADSLAVKRIIRDFEDLNIRVIVDQVVHLLTECMVIMVTTTGTGALLGGVAGFFGGFGVGAVPGATAGAELGVDVGVWILAALGLKALAEYVVQGVPAIGRLYLEGLRQAWFAATPASLAQQPICINDFAVNHAAEKLARAHVAMFVLLLMAIVAYVTRKGGTMSELASKAGRGRLGKGFAEWLIKNEARLKEHPRLRAPEPIPPSPVRPSEVPVSRVRRPSSGNDPAAATERPPLRQAYVDEVNALKGQAEKMKAGGSSPEQIARKMHQARRDLGVKYKNLTPPDKLKEIYARNLGKYNDKLGPSIDWLRAHGKSWDDIIESACRTGGKDLGF